ncbi:MAG: right-handed parallel beta-helix repeat-containing protein [Tabrizicola sp.]|nr:right-handed parallel beta-helix repeat-containing protein [Tabrizicola sp.]
MQLALTQLTIMSGSNGQLMLLRAQGGREDAVFVLSGNAGLADLEGDQSLVSRRGNVWVLHRPVIVWPGASLQIASGEEMEFDATTGAFLLSFGSVTVDGGTIRGAQGKNASVAEFRPFVLTAGQGVFRASGATFEALGFQGPQAFRGVTVLSEGLLKPAAPPVISGSRFRDVAALGLIGAQDAVILDNVFQDAAVNAIAVTDAAGVTIGRNRIAGTKAGAGLRLAGTLNDVEIHGNTIEGGGRNGIQIGGASLGVTLKANVVAANKGAGIAITRARCAMIRGNIILRNGTSGLRLRESGGAEVAQNAIFENGSAGVEVQGQAGLAAITVSDNVLRRNREGFNAAGIGEVRLKANDLAVQLPRQFSGDFAPYLSLYLAAAGNGAFVIPASAGAAPAPDAPCVME